MTWFGPHLERMLAVVAATLDEDGTLLEANDGFLRLFLVEGVQSIGARADQFFIQPNFATLVGTRVGADGEITAAF